MSKYNVPYNQYVCYGFWILPVRVCYIVFEQKDFIQNTL